MDTSIFILLVAAWLLVIGIALAATLALTAAENEPQGNSLFHRFILALARSRQRKAQLVIDHYRPLAATKPQERDPHAAVLTPARSSEPGGALPDPGGSLAAAKSRASHPDEEMAA